MFRILNIEEYFLDKNYAIALGIILVTKIISALTPLFMLGTVYAEPNTEWKMKEKR